MMPGETQIEQEMALFPGLGRMQAINRIRQRTYHMAERRSGSRSIASGDARPIGEIIAPIINRPWIITDAVALERSLDASRVLHLGPGRVCAVEGIRMMDWIDDLSPGAAADVLRQPISESRRTCPFPITRDEFARLKARAAA